MLDISQIKQWCIINGYQPMLVTLLLGDSEQSAHYETHVLRWDCYESAFIWDTDWYEGQHYVEIIGFIPINKIRVTGTFPKYVVWDE